MLTVRKNDIGVIIRVTISDDAGVVDLSGTSGNLLLLRKPSGEVLSKSASLYNLGVAGQIQYTTISGDLDETGRWEAQAFIDLGSTELKSTSFRFRVEPVISA